MPRHLDHQHECARLEKLAPDALQTTTVRLPAALLVKAHQQAKWKGLNLTDTIRYLITLGLAVTDRFGKEQLVKEVDEDELEQLDCMANFVEELRKHVPNLVLDATFAERIGRAVQHYEETVERHNSGSTSDDDNGDED
jgi:hypothetical protein